MKNDEQTDNFAGVSTRRANYPQPRIDAVSVILGALGAYAALDVLQIIAIFLV
jgi:hypothetical protein